MPCESQEPYAACVANPASFRQHLTAVCGQHPELFPASISEGFVLHDKRWSIKQQGMLRRLALKATAEVFLVRPSCLLPSMVGRTEAVEQARGASPVADAHVGVERRVGSDLPHVVSGLPVPHCRRGGLSCAMVGRCSNPTLR